MARCVKGGPQEAVCDLQSPLPPTHAHPVLRRGFGFLKRRSVSDQQRDCITRKTLFIFALEW